MLGSYLGVSMGWEHLPASSYTSAPASAPTPTPSPSLRKDLGIAECEVKQTVPQCWQKFQDYLANNTDLGAEFQYDNLTGDRTHVSNTIFPTD